MGCIGSPVSVITKALVGSQGRPFRTDTATMRTQSWLLLTLADSVAQLQNHHAGWMHGSRELLGSLTMAATTTSTAARSGLWTLGVKSTIARRGTGHGSVLGAQHWVAKQAFAHLHGFRRLRIRWETRNDIHEPFLTCGCALICR